ncbi:MAG: heavy-metal-associated domain-containing protein [Clostridiales bacterium]|jgi:copper chaperone CopZ|nr:heavy-metal-associated domain-containing protein [Clostridiales bacterium]
MLVMLLVCALGAIGITLLIRWLRNRHSSNDAERIDRESLEERLEEMWEEKDQGYYPWIKTLEIEGMVGERCVFVVRNALNSVKGAHAAVSLSKQQAVVYLQRRVEDSELREAVAKEGYSVRSITTSNLETEN